MEVCVFLKNMLTVILALSIFTMADSAFARTKKVKKSKSNSSRSVDKKTSKKMKTTKKHKAEDDSI
jgi:hypothetical protein